jgi:hypothetical protein
LTTNSIKGSIYKHGTDNISSFLNKPLQEHLGPTPIIIIIIIIIILFGVKRKPAYIH